MQVVIFDLLDNSLHESVKYYVFTVDDLEANVKNAFAIFDALRKQHKLRGRRFNLLFKDKVFYMSKRGSGKKIYFECFPMFFLVEDSEN